VFASKDFSMLVSRHMCRASSPLLTETFLCAAALPKRNRGAAADTHDVSLVAGTSTGFEMLKVHGPHHGSLVKKRLAAFVGVPTAAQLALIKAVASELGP